MSLPPDQLEAAARAATASLEPDSTVPLIRNPLFPWDQMDAVNRPTAYLAALKEVIPVLAALTAQGPSEPRLLRVDAADRLVTVTGSDLVLIAPSGAIAGANQIAVEDATGVAQGMYLKAVPNGAGPLVTDPTLYRVTSVADNVIGISPTLLGGLALNAILLVVPFSVGDLLGPGNLAANQPVQQIDFSVAAGATQALITFLGTDVVRLVQLSISFDVAAYGKYLLNTPNLNVLHTFGGATEYEIPFRGMPITNVTGVGFKNNSAGPVHIVGSLQWSKDNL